LKEITVEELLNINNPIIIDIRSPIEYKDGAIPGAINIPLFTDEERQEVGTIYKHEGQDQAKWRAMEIVSPKLPSFHKSIKEVSPENYNQESDNGPGTTYTYDSMNRLVLTSDASGNIVQKNVYDVNGNIITSRRSINRTKLSKEVDLKDAKVITKYYLEETEGDYSDEGHKNMRYFNVVNLGYFRSYEKTPNDINTNNDNEKVRKMLISYDENFNEFDEINDEKFINSDKKL
jgi:hypothetical protein